MPIGSSQQRAREYVRSLRMTEFEFHVFPADEHGRMDSADEFIETKCLIDQTAAKGYAGMLAKRHRGPVDIAYAGDELWYERYVTTASPSEHHRRGFRFERLD